MPQTKEPILLARQVEVPRIVVFMNLEYLGFDWHGGLTFTKTSGAGITFRMHLDHYTDGNPWFKTELELNVGMGFKYISVAPPDDIHELQNLYFALAGEELEMML